MPAVILFVTNVLILVNSYTADLIIRDVYFRSRYVGMTGFVYYFNGGTGLNDIIEHERIRSLMQ